jgi:hypothetical protein
MHTTSLIDINYTVTDVVWHICSLAAYVPQSVYVHLVMVSAAIMSKRSFVWVLPISAIIGIFSRYLYSNDYSPFQLNGRWNGICADPAYTPRILSYDPLIIHLENFLT